MNDQIFSMQAAEQSAAEQGFILSPADRAKIAQLQRAERERLESIAQSAKGPESGALARFNSFYPTLLAALLKAGDTLITLAQTLIVAFGVPVVLVLLLIVEHQRVFHGIALFEPEPALASFAALALVLLNLVLEFQIHYIEMKAGYAAERDQEFSLRLIARRLVYIIGMGDSWAAREQSPAARYRRLLRLVTFSILALALAGSMRAAIGEQPGAWYDALYNIMAASTLQEITVWLGGLLFAAAAVLAAQGLSRYVAIRCAEIVGAMTAAQSGPDYSGDMDRIGAQYIAARLVERERQAQAKAAAAAAKQSEAAAANVPLVEMYHNGNGHGPN